MSDELLTAGKIAAAVKKAITTLKLAPTSKKGACCYYGADAVAKIKKAVKS